VTNHRHKIRWTREQIGAASASTAIRLQNTTPVRQCGENLMMPQGQILRPEKGS
jgi:hypothetical protein